MTITRGTAWGGNYSRFSFDPTKDYVALLKEKAVPVLDDEMNFMQDAVISALRNAVADITGEGAVSTGFFISSVGANNDFSILPGVSYVSGLRARNAASRSYLSQSGVAALTTPSAARIDTVYLDFWLDEVEPSTDAAMVDPTLGVETSRRLQAMWRVRVAEGTQTLPPSFTASDGIPHYTLLLAYLHRTNTAAITAAMTEDKRFLLGVAASAYSTGDTKLTIKNQPDAGWFFMNDGTIGSPSSGATARANWDARALYSLIWNNCYDADAPVVGGRGSNAGADFDANKSIRMPETVGCALGVSGFKTVPGRALSGHAVGSAFGSETHTLLTAEMPGHHHSNDGSSISTDNGAAISAVLRASGIGANVSPSTANTTETGGGAAHSIMQPTAFFNLMVKL